MHLNRRLLWAGLAGLAWCGALNAQVLIGEGYAADAAEAKKFALVDLASAVKVDVFNEVEICQQQAASAGGADCGSKALTRTRADLPLLGVEYRELPRIGATHGWQARLDPSRVVDAYRTALQDLARAINEREGVLGRTRDQSARLRLLTQQMTDVRQYEKHRLVAIMLGDRSLGPAAVSEVELEARLQALDTTADSLAFAGRLLARDIGQRGIYVHAPRPREAEEITPFAAALRDAVAANLATVTAPARAGFLYQGEYTLLDGGDIHATYRLIDASFNTVESRSVRIAKAAYAGFRAQPLAADFDRLLHQQVAVSNEFRSEIATDRGSRDLLFKQGEPVRLVARLSGAGYFYLVGHVVRDGEQFSYLVELSDAQGPDRFLRYVPPDQANHYLDLGEFLVEPPFGAEHLQLIAANQSLRDRLPPHGWDGRRGYYVIAGSEGAAQAGVAATRGLKPARKQDPQSQARVLSHESVLTFTTLPKQ